MKIIEEHHGKRIKCDSCESILEYLPTDEHKRETNYHRYDKYIICPICGHEIYTLQN